jgi:hypothetical protein
MNDASSLQIRSYRVCFEMEHRIHKIDQWRVPVPHGVPLRGIAYFCGLFVAILVLSSLPVIGVMVGLLHPVLRFVMLPVGGSMALLRWRLDGRPAHRVARAWVRMQIEPRRLAAFRTLPAAAAAAVSFDDVVAAPDDRTGRLRKGAVHGPARVTFRLPVQTSAKRRSLHVRQAGEEPLWRGTQVTLHAGQRLVVR